MQITINITSVTIRQYVDVAFKRNSDGYIASTRTATGMLICALAKSTPRPPMTSGGEQSVSFSVPINEVTMPLRGKFLMVSLRDQMAINSMLRREFNMAFHQFVTEGITAGFRRKELIEMFIEKYQLGDIETVFDMLSKKRYRAKLYAARLFGKKLKKTAHHDTDSGK